MARKQKKTEEHKEKEERRVGLKHFSPRTINQSKYVKSMEENDLTFGIGPAGTGKTLLGVSYAINQILLNKYKRLVITRPIVEAGEQLGFLPGDITEKVDPYLRPIYDFVLDIIGHQHYRNWMSNHVEIAPLAFMRGRTFDNSILILDEAQNTTKEQMLLFLTRIGLNSKAIITADPSQIDLKKKYDSGITEAIHILHKCPSIKFINLTDEDIIRSAIVKTVTNAYREHRGNGHSKEMPILPVEKSGIIIERFNETIFKEEKPYGEFGEAAKAI